MDYCLAKNVLSGIRYPLSGIRYPVSAIRYPLSGISTMTKTTRVFIRVNTKTSRDKIKANQMDFIKTKCKQRNVNRIA